ncbi:hypothetical protein A6C57_03240 [Fibrella sp. ES10-3-2-2]|nr:hypothetical protein A6C57_03240 [Fibrella sp. ES10-3-2-2]
MEGPRFIYELLGLIIAASFLAFLTRPTETEFSRRSLARYRRRQSRKKHHTLTVRPESTLREPWGTSRNAPAKPITDWSTDATSTDND